MSDAGRRYYNAAGGFLDAPDDDTVGQSAAVCSGAATPRASGSLTGPAAIPPRSAESWQWPAREQREWERDQRDHDDRDPDPLASIYAVDEPQEWRA